jgi:hypothetical protein
MHTIYYENDKKYEIKVCSKNDKKITFLNN